VSPTGNDATEDRALLARVANTGCERSFAALFQRYAARIQRFARTLAPSNANADDIVQHTFVAAMKYAARYRGESTVKAWLFTIARNEAFRLRREAGRQVDSEPTLLELGVRAGWGSDTPETEAVRRQQVEALRAALAALPTESAEILVLRDLEGFSGADTAALLGISLAAQKSRLHRARLQLLARVKEGSTP